MEKNELCKTIKLRRKFCQFLVFCIINFKCFMVAWSNFQVNWDQIIVTKNALLLYETRKWNSLGWVSSWDFRLTWVSDKTQGDIFLWNLSELLPANAGDINLVINNSHCRWHLNIYVNCENFMSYFLFLSFLLHWYVLSFICL